MKAIAKVFNQIAARHHASFPQELSNLYIERPDGKIIYETPGMKRFRAAKPDAFQRVARKVNRAWSVVPTSGLVESGRYGQENVKYIRLNVDERLYIFMEGEHAQFLSLCWLLNHELGHSVVSAGRSRKLHRAECAADAYALLRHIQSFGLDESQKTDIRALSVNFMIQGISPINYTAAALEKVLMLYQEDPDRIRRMTLQETAALAEKITRGYSLAEKDIKKINAALAPLRQISDDAPRPDYFRTLINIARKNTHDEYIYRACKNYLETPYARKWVQYTIGQEPELQPLLKEMVAHETATSFILNGAEAIDAKKKKADPKAGL